MASPQKEEGFTPIAHEILRALSTQVISPDEWRILMIIFWKTYGWGKKEDRISLGQFEEWTGIARRHVTRSISKLIKRQILYKSVPQSGNSKRSPNREQGVPRSGNSQIATYGFQKDYDLWCSLNGERGVPCLGNKVFPDQGTTKEYKEKDLYSSSEVSTVPQSGNSRHRIKNPAKTFAADSPEFLLASLLLKKITDRKPTFKKPNIQIWSHGFDRILRLDGRSRESVTSVIEWCQKDLFWQNNILSPDKLREKFDQLELRMQAQAGPGSYPNGSQSGSGYQAKKDVFKQIKEHQKQIEAEKKKGTTPE